MDYDFIKKRIVDLPSGCELYKSDLHIHTSASHDYSNKTITAEQIVNEAIKKKIGIIGITDHNTVEGIERIREAAKDKPIIVFPGVEITVPFSSNGIHILAYFDIDKNINEINECLVQIGLSKSEQQKNEEATSIADYEKVFRIINESGGLVVAAHAWSNKGIIKDLSGQTRIKLVQNKNIIAMEYKQIEDKKFLDGSDPKYERAVACIQGSDAHNLADIGKDYSVIKLGEVNIEGLRQAFCDFKSRIKHSSEEIITHPYIVGMYVDGGFLDGQTFHFNDNLNALIGGKGSGKTCTIELLRFAMNSKSRDERIDAFQESMINGVLGNGTIYVLVKSKDRYYFITRNVANESNIFHEDGSPFDVDIETFRGFFDIEAYSQGELIHIAESPINQLEMLDEYINFGDNLNKEKEILQKLNDNGKKLLTNTTQIDDWNSQIKELPAIKEKISIIEKNGLKGHNDEERKYLYEKTVYQQLANEIDNITTSYESKIDSLKLKYDFEEKDATSDDTIKNALKLVDSFNSIIEEIKTKIKEDIIKLGENIKTSSDGWQEKYTKYQENFKEKLAGLEIKDLNIADYQKLEEQRIKLDGLLSKIKDKEKEDSELRQERIELLKQLNDIRKNIYQLRKEEVERINKKLDSMVKVSLSHEGSKKIYIDWLTDVLSGSNTRSSSILNICENLKPIEFYKEIKDKDNEELINFLITKCDITEKSAETIINFPKFKSNIFDLETVRLDDELDIKFYDHGWKSLSKLSIGGKCTTILLIALLERDNPLLIDQPEDSLDNEFIYSAVVETMRDLKGKRQIIVVTHNANIPILGDCEQMFFLKSDGLNGKILCNGVIDNNEIKEKAQLILEGSEQAFKRRKEKYGI